MQLKSMPRAASWTRVDVRIGFEIDGVVRPDLDGCLDVDFESSAVANTLPIHRLPFVVGATYDVPAAFVQADDLGVIRLEQRHTLLRSPRASSSTTRGSPSAIVNSRSPG